ncbi:MAG: rhodanese-like domain-containing protein, partial [Actinobacteria bacterium]|nr:rhodanese-like domain-containing protein [Actinomycetota bacterium]
GFGTTYNVTHGFEGGPGAVGWKHAGLPWTQG